MGKFADNCVLKNEQIMRNVEISSLTLDKTEKHFQFYLLPKIFTHFKV